jgi:putative hydrolase of the HAD superfamily
MGVSPYPTRSSSIYWSAGVIKAVLFDFGGVLSEGGKAGAIRSVFAKAYGVPADSLRFEQSGLQALKGLISDDEFLAAMNQRHPDAPPVTKRQFMATASALTRCEPVYQLAQMLRDHGIATGLFSNTLRMTVTYLRGRGLYDAFDPLLLSCDMHTLKPELQFYQLALDRLGLPPHEVLLIDDQQKFLDPARTMGMRTILATSPQQIVHDTKALIEEENSIQL